MKAPERLQRQTGRLPTQPSDGQQTSYPRSPREFIADTSQARHGDIKRPLVTAAVRVPS